MAYTKVQWRNNQSPPINADNLNHIEEGIYEAHQTMAENTQSIESLTTQTGANTSAITSETIARQQADSAETLAREQTDNSLQSQINQIIAPSGEAPSAAEVENARIGATIMGGETYDTLGNAIRGQVTELKNDLTSSVLQLGNGKIIETNYIWEHGEIDSSTGGNVYSANSLRTKGYYSTADIDYVELTDDSQSLRIYYYTDNTGTYDSTDAINGPDILTINKTKPYYRLRLLNDDYSLVTNADSIIGYTIASFQTSIDNLFALSSGTEKVVNEIFPIMSEISVDTTTNNYRLKTDGFGIVDTNYKLLKYVIVGGEKIKILGSDHLFQFQSRMQVNTSGTTYRVGETYGVGNYVLDAPPTATCLIISTKTDTTDIKVYALNDRIDAIDNVIDSNFIEETQSLSGTTSNAYINSNGVITSYSGNERVLEVSVSSGETLKINAWGYNNNYLFTFYDDNEVLTGGYKNQSGAEKAISNYEVIVPPNTTKIAISGNKNKSPAPSGSKTIKVDPNASSSRWAGKKWVVIGDSLTESNSRTTKNYHTYVAEATGITVVNMGVSGTGYRNGGNSNNPFYSRVSSVPTDADVVTIFGSFNDGLTDLGTATDSGTTTVGGCINTTIDNLYAVFPTVQLGIVSPTPWVGANPYNHSEANAYADLLEAICKRRSIPFLNLYYESNLRPWDSTFRELAYSKDDGNGVHPDETGHLIISSRFEGFLDDLLLG